MLKFSIFDQKTESKITELMIQDIYDDDLIVTSLKENGFLKNEIVKVVRAVKEIIIQIYDEENESWSSIYWIVRETFDPGIVYRIQDAAGLGPYSGIGQTILFRSPNSVGPSPEYDGLPKEAINALDSKIGQCAFISMNQLYRWFSKEQIELLKIQGYSVVEVRAKHIWFGNSQVVYIPE